ncbi:DNA-processing protein DprA [Microbacterium sp. ACRRU]|uniref:DNA-processing protein DprA n=1 Tax=Microbacterium sp. ACRRU TaxID=2918204 RepID=UPI001EF5F890|nr:DNA-processing protein DprA [Microbacterium sp. ACRRU]MCG7417330.1 DNA-processing protein DprA [Microbacterium sp. ACRRU]
MPVKRSSSPSPESTSRSIAVRVSSRSWTSTEGRTIAFLAGGVDRAYPRGHESLLASITKSGAVVSETPCGAAPTTWRFLSPKPLI